MSRVVNKSGEIHSLKISARRGPWRRGQVCRFDQRAHLYSRWAVVQRKLAAWLAEWLEPADQTTQLAALELGAGDGLFTRLLAHRFSNLSATDLAPRMVEQGRHVLSNVRWRVTDAWDCDIAPVDRLFSSSLLHWCEDPVLVLSHWHTLINQGGRALHGFYVAPSLVQWQSIAGIPSPIRWRSPRQWEEYFRNAGWTVLRSEARAHVERFPSPLAALRFFHRTGCIAPRQSSVSTMRRILADLGRESAESGGSAGVTTKWTFFRIEVVNQYQNRAISRSDPMLQERQGSYSR